MPKSMNGGELLFPSSFLGDWDDRGLRELLPTDFHRSYEIIRWIHNDFDKYLNARAMMGS